MFPPAAANVVSVARAGQDTRGFPKPSQDRRARPPRRSCARSRRSIPDADTELHYSNAYQLLVATILSAQCTDERVNQVTPALFTRYPDAAALAKATTSELEPQIQSTGFFRAKSKSLARHGARGRRAARRRDSGDDGRADGAAGRRPQDGQRRARPRAGRPGCRSIATCCVSPIESASRESDDPVVVEQQLCAALPPRNGRGRPTR